MAATAEHAPGRHAVAWHGSFLVTDLGKLSDRSRGRAELVPVER